MHGPNPLPRNKRQYSLFIILWRSNTTCEKIIHAAGSENILLVPRFLFQFSCMSVSVSKCHLCISAVCHSVPDQFIIQKVHLCEERQRREWKRRRGEFLPDPAPVCDCCCWAARLDVTWGGVWGERRASEGRRAMTGMDEGGRYQWGRERERQS